MISRTPRHPDIFRILLILIPCIMFCYELVGYSQFAGWDVTRLNLPLKWFDVQSIRNGAMPLWNPYLYAGMPQLAESESGLFYPGNWLLHLPGNFFYWANLTIILHFVLAGLFFDLWLRGRGVDRRMSFFGAVLFQNAPFLIFHISSMALMQAAVWFPLLLWIADRAIELRDRVAVGRLFGWTALLGGMLLLVGNVQIVFYEGLMLFFYLFGHVISSREDQELKIKRSIGILVSILLGGILIGAVIWIPAREFAASTVREAPDRAFYRLGTWLTPSRLASAFLFPAYGLQTEMVHWASSLIYVGLLPSILALLRLMGIKVNWRRDAPLIIMGGLALFLAFGMYNPVNHLLVKIPPFSMFRYQGRFALGAMAALIALAVSGFEKISEKKGIEIIGSEVIGAEKIGTGPISSEKLYLSLFFPRLKWALGIIALSLFFFFINAKASKAILWGSYVLFADIALTWWAVATIAKSCQTTRFPLWIVAYVLFHLIIVFPVGRIATMPMTKFNEALTFFDQLKRDDGLPARLLVVDVGRFADRDLLAFNKFTPQDNLPNLCAGNTSVFRNVQTMEAYTPLRPKYWDYITRNSFDKGFTDSAESGVLDATNAKVLQMLGVDAVVTSGGVKQIPGYHQADTNLDLSFGPNARLYIANTSQPRVWTGSDAPCNCDMVGGPDFQMDTLSDTLEKLESPPYLRTTSGVLRKNHGKGQYLQADHPLASDDGIHSIKFTGNIVTIDLTTKQDPEIIDSFSWCILEMSYDRDWQATLDGKAAETAITNGLFFGVKIPKPGDHVITMTYNPLSFHLGAPAPSRH